MKLVALSKISSGVNSGSSSPDTTPLLNTEHVFETLSLEIGKKFWEFQKFLEIITKLSFSRANAREVIRVQRENDKYTSF